MEPIRSRLSSAVVILMAGASRRMGRPKATVTVRGKPLLAHALDTARQSGVADIVVVLGRGARAITDTVDTSGARVVINPRADRGMGSSLAAGVGAVAPGVEQVAVLLGDQPNVSADLVRRLLDLHAASDAAAAAVSCDGLTMPPVVLGGAFLQAALHATGDQGLRDMLRAQQDSVVLLPVTSDMVLDVDTPEDLERLGVA